MKKRNLIIITFLFLFILTIPAIASVNLTKWHYYKDIEGTAGADQKYAMIELDQELLNNSYHILSDVRILDNQGQEIPYFIQNNNQETFGQVYAASILNKSVVPGQFSTFIFDLQKQLSEPHNRLSIIINGTNYLRLIEIEGSDDSATWHKIDSDEHIYSVQGQANNSIKYNQNNFRYLRVKIWNKGEEPLNIIGAQVHYIKEAPQKEKILTEVNMTQSEEKKNKSSILKLDLGQKNIPSNQINLTTSETNFKREVIIEGSNDNKMWSAISRDVIYSTDIDNYKFNKLNVAYVESRYRYLKLTINNQDNQPLKINKATVVRQPQNLIFAWTAKQNYKLYYGNPDVLPPTYDINELANYINQNKLPVLTLSKEKLNPNYVATRTSQPWSENNKWLLVVVLIAVVFVMGFIIMRMVKKISAGEHR